MWTGRKSITVPADTSEVASRPEPLVMYTLAVNELEVFAKSDNTSSIWIGNVDVSADPGYEAGVELAAGASYRFDAIDVSTVYIAGTTEGDAVTWNAF